MKHSSTYTIFAVKTNFLPTKSPNKITIFIGVIPKGADGLDDYFAGLKPGCTPPFPLTFEPIHSITVKNPHTVMSDISDALDDGHCGNGWFLVSEHRTIATMNKCAEARKPKLVDRGVAA